jgi:spoIIIJ-associated protein
VEWVETTGRTLEDAKEAALDELGVDESDAEFEILEEPRAGLFGRTRGGARVRARVRPAAPRAKIDARRDRRRRANRSRERKQGERADQAAGPTGDDSDEQEDAEMEESDVPVAEQAELARDFVDGLIDAFGFDGAVSTAVVDDDTIEVSVAGEDLGLLIGPKGQTLLAIQELTRTAVQRRVPGRTARLHVDVAGYREKRREALERFTQQVVEAVLESGSRRVLEPMNAADRKVVHDTANAIGGVSTVSEGEDPDRRVVILPAD